MTAEDTVANGADDDAMARAPLQEKEATDSPTLCGDSASPAAELTEKDQLLLQPTARPVVVRKVSSTVSHTHSQSRSTTVRRLQRLWSRRGSLRPRLDSYPDHLNTRRVRRLDSFSHAELLVLQLVVERAIQRDDDDRAFLHRQLGHPFLSRQRELLQSVISAQSPLGKSLLATVNSTTKTTTTTTITTAVTHNKKMKKPLQMDYPVWRKKHFQKPIDQRLQLRRRAFLRLFPVLQSVPRSAGKRIFNVYDRNMSGKIEFTELCESLARCAGGIGGRYRHGNMDDDDDDRIAMVFEWFMDKHAFQISRQGVGLLEATLRAIQTYYKVALPPAQQLVTRTTTTLCKELLAGQPFVLFDDFYESMSQLPDVVELLMKPFDLLAPLVNEHELLDVYESKTWREGDVAYLVDAKWWTSWVDHFKNTTPTNPTTPTFGAATNNNQKEPTNSTTIISSSNNQELHNETTTTTLNFPARIGSITNGSLCQQRLDNDDDSNANHGGSSSGRRRSILKPALELGKDFVVVPRTVWHKLQCLYGGGPEYARKVVVSAQVPTTPPPPPPTTTNENQQNVLASESESDSNPPVREELLQLNDSVGIQLYPLVVGLRVVRTDATQTTLLLARQCQISRKTKLKELLHRLGLAPGVNIHSVSIWLRRDPLDPWRRIAWSLESLPQPTLCDVGVQCGHDLLIDFKPFASATGRGGRHGSAAAATASSSTQTPTRFVADDRLVFSLYQPMGNDFLCRAPGSGIESALSATAATDQQRQQHDDGDDDEGEREHSTWDSNNTNATAAGGGGGGKKNDIVDDKVGELYTGGQSGLLSNTGFFMNFNDPFKLTLSTNKKKKNKKNKNKKSSPRILSSGSGASNGGGVRATGLVNMGNTCFLNCALQCLGHSPVLREYFVSQRFTRDLNTVNPLGTKGKVAVSYSLLMQTLWSELRHHRASSFAPSLFRDEFARHRSQFQEASQHDAHEFIVSLLDALHEDLNRQRGGHGDTSGGGRTGERRGGGSGLFCLPFYGSSSTGDGSDDADYDGVVHHRSYPAVASSISSSPSPSSTTTTVENDIRSGAMAWQSHVNVNASIVVDLFHGQLRSETICGSCDERKAIFDPFLFLSVPIPEPKFLRVEVKLLFQVRSSSSESPLRRQGFWLPRESTVAHLCDAIATLYKLPAQRFVVVEVRRNRIKRIFDDVEKLEMVATSMVRELYAYERAWTLDDIPWTPSWATRAIANSQNGGSESTEPLEPIEPMEPVEPVGKPVQPVVKAVEPVEPVDEPVLYASFQDLHVGARVDGLGFHGDWHPGTIVGVSEGSTTVGVVLSRVLVHFDAFSAKWDKWFSCEDWHEQNLLPVYSKTSKCVEVFEVQVVHRRVVPLPSITSATTAASKARASTTTYARPYDDLGDDQYAPGEDRDRRRTNSTMEIFGEPMFVTIGSDKTAKALHGAVLLQASRFIQERLPAGREIPYETRVVDLDEVSVSVGVSLPYDTSNILQHFATQSVIVLDWKNAHKTYIESNDGGAIDDYIPLEMAQLEQQQQQQDQGQAPDSMLNNSTSLKSCLNAHFKTEAISLDDNWKCDKCGTHRAGTRRSDLWKLPDLVMIQLKRFQYQENGFRQKVRTLVDFPLHGLDFTQWMGSSSSNSSSSATTETTDCVYDLYAVANHVGGLARGHYTAYCKYDADFEESAQIFQDSSSIEMAFQDMWFRFDDEKVVELASDDVVSDAAYVLFYKRRKLSPQNVLAYSM